MNLMRITKALLLSGVLLLASAQASAQSCFWQSNTAGYPWVASPTPAPNEAACKKLDSCSPDGGKASNGGCYKWAVSAAALNTPAPTAKMAQAGSFPDGAKVMIKYPGWNSGTRTITLKAEGVDKAGGIYTIQLEGQNKYLMAKDSEERTTVGLSTPDAKVTPTKWILHQHGVPFQIMHTANGANAISVNDSKNGLVLRRNQGDERQRIVIQEIRSRNLGGGVDIKWTNKTGVPITVNWIDAGGKEMPSDRIIKPNEVFDGSTFIGHVFRVRDEKRAEIYLIEVEATSAKVDIKT